METNKYNILFYIVFFWLFLLIHESQHVAIYNNFGCENIQVEYKWGLPYASYAESCPSETSLTMAKFHTDVDIQYFRDFSLFVVTCILFIYVRGLKN